MGKINALIVDSELSHQKLFLKMLAEFCPNVKVLGVCGSVSEAKNIIEKNDLQLLFLNVNLEDGTAFDLLDDSYTSIPIIFTSESDKDAINAFKYNAIDYLLKPIKELPLIAAVDKAKRSYPNSIQQLRGHNKLSSKIALSTVHGFEIFDLATILYLESDKTQTTFYFENGNPILVNKAFSYYEPILEDLGFYRIHNSIIVNTSKVASIDTKSFEILLTNGKILPLSRRRKANILSSFGSVLIS